MTFTFTVDAATEGNATFYVDGNPVYSVDVVNGVATYQTATLAPGQQTISVMFTTDGMTFDVPGIRQTVFYCC